MIFQKMDYLCNVHNLRTIFFTSINTFFKTYQKNKGGKNIQSKKSRTVLGLYNKIITKWINVEILGFFYFSLKLLTRNLTNETINL